MWSVHRSHGDGGQPGWLPGHVECVSEKRKGSYLIAGNWYRDGEVL